MAFGPVLRVAVVPVIAVLIAPWPGAPATASAATTAVATETATTTCPAPVFLANGSFEQPVTGAGSASGRPPGTVPGWRTTESDGRIEIWHPPVASFNHGLEIVPADGSQFAEIAANEASTLYQDIATVPGQRMAWRVFHRARNTAEGPGPDTMRVLIGPPEDPVPQTPRGATDADITDGVDSWAPHGGVYVVPPGQTVTRFAFESVETGSGDPSRGNFLDRVEFANAPCIVATMTVTGATGPGGAARVGDVLTYTITTTNDSTSPTHTTRLRDVLPPALAYVPGTLTVDGATATDQAGDDVGEVDGRLISARLGAGADATSGGVLPVGGSAVVRLQARVMSTDLDAIVNTAEIAGDWEAAGIPLSAVLVSTSVLVAAVEPPPLPAPAEPVDGSTARPGADGDELALSGDSSGALAVAAGTWLTLGIGFAACAHHLRRRCRASLRFAPNRASVGE